MCTIPFPVSLASVQALFQSHFLPTVTGHAMRRFRRHPEREDMVAESVAFAWAAVRRLWERGEPCDHLVGAIALQSARRVAAGRRVAGVQKRKAKARDVYTCCQRCRGATAEAYAEERSAHMPEDAGLRMDLERLAGELDGKEKIVFDSLALGEQCGMVDCEQGFSRGTANYYRTRIRDRWTQLQAM